MGSRQCPCGQRRVGLQDEGGAAEFQAVLDDLKLGLVDGIVVYDLDRFARQPVDLERAIRLFDDRPGLVFATVQSDIDLSTSDGWTMAWVMVAFANKSSMDTSRRIGDKHQELAQAGIPPGGWRQFGYKPDRRTLDLEEAALVCGRRMMFWPVSQNAFDLQAVERAGES